MTAPVEFTPPAADQALLRTVLRAGLRVLFRGLVRPPMPIAGQRVVLRALTSMGKLPRGITRSAGTLGGRPCEWHKPPSGRGTVMLYLHGGAYIIGGANTHRALCAHLAKRGQMDVCALDYRLAPEYPYPAARDDAVAAIEALLEMGYAPEQIVVGGDSAGGNLSLISSLRLRDLGRPQPAALVCFSPVTDFTGAHLHEPPAGDPLINRAWVEQALSLYCPPPVWPTTTPACRRSMLTCTGCHRCYCRWVKTRFYVTTACVLPRKPKLPGWTSACNATRTCGMCFRPTRAP